MIDQGVFNVEWAVLCERFNRDPSEVLAARYYQSLSAQMDTEDFRRAAKAVFDRCEFFPRPADFVEAVQGDGSELAAEDWALCQRVMSGETSALARMSVAGRKTVRLMGGADRLRMARIADNHYRRAEFLRLHGSAQDIARREEGAAIGPASSDARGLLESATPRLMRDDE